MESPYKKYSPYSKHRYPKTSEPLTMIIEFRFLRKDYKLNILASYVPFTYVCPKCGARQFHRHGIYTRRMTMINELTFKDISIRGRVAFAINCLEKYLSSLDLNLDDWNIVLHKYWSFTDIEFLDDWNDIISEILPDNLLEFDNYQKHGFDYLNEDEFKNLYNLYRNIDNSVMELMRLIFELGSSHAYSVIINEGNASLRIVQDILVFMNLHNIGLPSTEVYQSMLIQDNRGWGNEFKGKDYSLLL